MSTTPTEKTSIPLEEKPIKVPISEDGSVQDESKTEDEDYILTGAKLHIILFALGLAIFLLALDMSILATAIPLITEKFQSTTDIGWYISAYTLSLSTLQPLSGKLYANFSLKWTFLVLLLVFELGSAISGAATSSNMLIVGRFIAGVGAAGLMSGGLSIVAIVVTKRLRGLYMGIMNANFSIALICGPLLGGVFTQHVSWRWVFYIRYVFADLPLGAVTVIALLFMFKPPTRAVERKSVKERIKRLDLLGAAIFIPAVFMILLALQWGGVKYAWSSSRIIGLFVGGGTTLLLFAVYQWYKGDMAMIPPSILTNRTVLFASLAAMFGMTAPSLMGMWMPEWFQIIKGVSPVQSGVNMMPTMLAQLVSTVVAGGMISWLGYYNPFLLLGTMLVAIGSGLLTSMEIDTSSGRWIGYQVIFGFGSGMFTIAPLVAVQSVLSRQDTPVGIATVTFFQLFGGALFAALSQTIFNKQLEHALVRFVPGVNLGAILAAGTLGFHKVVKPEQLAGVLQAYNIAILDTFYLAAAVTAVGFLFSLGVPWISVKGKSLTAGMA